MSDPKFLYIAVSHDEYELPIAVADTATQLAKILGLRDDSSVPSAIYRARRGGYWCRYRKVPYITDEEEEE